MTVTVKIPKNIRDLGKGFNKREKRKALKLVGLAVGGDIEKYPKANAGNRAPAPFYIRGRGTQLKSGRNLNNSQRMSTKWKHVVSADGEKLNIKNRATYSGFVIGQNQARFHARRGWVNVPKYSANRKNGARLARVYLVEMLKQKGFK